MRVAGRHAALREGAVGVLQRAQRARVPLHVLSVSWSGELVRGALQGAVAVAHGCAPPCARRGSTGALALCCPPWRRGLVGTRRVIVQSSGAALG